jgi:PKD repeat protein
MSLSVLSSAVAFSCFGLVACGSGGSSSPQQSAEHAGRVSLQLQRADGTTLNTVNYVIVGPSAYTKTGSLDVSNSSTVSGLISAIPGGAGYSIALTASSTDASLSCSGSASFDVTVHQTTQVKVALSCKAAAKTGSVLVNGALNICPSADGINASPSELTVGSSVALAALAHDTDAAPAALGYQWAASSGTLSNATAQNPTFTCTAAGPATLTLTVSDGDTSAGCTDSLTTTITCDAPQCAGGCDDGNPCTSDACGPNLACTHTTLNDGPLCQSGNLKVKLLGFNDFHGHISTGSLVSSRPVGSAAVLGAYLKAAQAGIENQTIIVHAGDHVGASPAASALLQDEPSIQWLNLLANSSCTYTDKMNPACNMVGTLGNHEFDEGKTELLRLLNGGNYSSGPFLEDPYKGARMPYVSANVVDEVTGRPILPPYVIKKVMGVPIAFVGAVLEATPTIVTPTGVAGLKFLDEADAANSYVPEIKALGVKTIDEHGARQRGTRRHGHPGRGDALGQRVRRGRERALALVHQRAHHEQRRQENPSYSSLLLQHGIRRHRPHDRSSDQGCRDQNRQDRDHFCRRGSGQRARSGGCGAHGGRRSQGRTARGPDCRLLGELLPRDSE